MRAISGLWPWGEGQVQIKDGAKILLMPQRAYVPTGTLRRATTYPAPPDATSSEDLARVLGLVGLSHLVDRLEEDAPWDQILSGGEKQRLAFARILLHAPDIIVLDEATSALDPPSQDRMMALLTEELHATTFVSVGHRPELEAFHDRKIVLARRHGGAQMVTDIELITSCPAVRQRCMARPPVLRANAHACVQGTVVVNARHRSPPLSPGRHS